MTINEKFEDFQAQGWIYIPDPKTWSGGIWQHETLGFVNRSGGTFQHIVDAVEALERFLKNLDRIK